MNDTDRRAGSDRRDSETFVLLAEQVPVLIGAMKDLDRGLTADEEMILLGAMFHQAQARRPKPTNIALTMMTATDPDERDRRVRPDR